MDSSKTSSQVKPDLVVFDLDHTLVKVNMSYAFGKYLYSLGAMPFPAMIRSCSAYLAHKGFGKSLHWLHQKIFDAYLKSSHKPTIKRHVDAFLDRDLKELFYPPAMACLKEAEARGAHLAILSSSPDFLVEAIAKRLNISTWIGTCYLVDKQELLCEIACIVDGDYKAEFLQRLMQAHLAEKKDVTVYSDSILDMPIFQMAGTKIAVNPSRALASFSRRHEWKVI